MNEAEIKARFPNASAAFIKANLSVGGVAPSPEQKRHSCDEPMAPVPRTEAHAGRRLVRVTSFRRHLLDERNLFEHYFIDALVRAGCLFDDSPAWAKIEVDQQRVEHPWEERTVIEVYDL